MIASQTPARAALRCPAVRRSCVVLCAALAAVLSTRANAQVSVLTQHNDNYRTGANTQETTLTTANVKPSTFGKLFTRPVDGEVYAQPLVVANLAIHNGTHNVVYVETMSNSVYAFDADGHYASPFWHVNLGAPVPASDVQCCCPDISTNVGIVGTPAIDPTAKLLYLVAKTKSTDGTYHQFLHALDLTTGAEKLNGPVEIAGQYGGLTFDPKIHNQRPALLLSNGVVYIAWASHNDCASYHGWIMGYDAATLAQKYVFAASISGIQAGFWQSGQGPTTDAAGNIYLMTGNGSFNYNSTTGSITDYGCSFLKLGVTSGGTFGVLDWFAPFNTNDLSAADTDLGSAGVLALPGTHLIVGGGKEGKMYVVDTTNMGHYQSGSDSQIVQSWQASNPQIHGSPIYYNSPTNGQCIFLWGEQDYLKVFSFNGQQFNTTPIAYSPEAVPNGEPGGFLSLSSNGNKAGTAIVWASHPYSGDANNAVVPGIVRAFDANTVTIDSSGVPRLTELWNSKMSGSRDDVGNFAKFTPPTIANGKVYMASFGPAGSPNGSGQLVVYGILQPKAPAAPTNLRATGLNKAITLLWAGSSGATSYNLYRSLTAGGEGTTPYKTGLTSAKFTDTGLTNGKTYYYQVTAVNGVGESKKSNEASSTPGPVQTITTVADTYAQSGANAANNYGTSAQLIVKINPPDLTRITFVKFDLSGITKPITGARFSLYGQRQGTNSSSRDSAYGVADSTWSETGLTWNNMPALGPKQQTITVTSTLGWYTWDVTPWIQSEQAAGHKTVTIAVWMDFLPADGYRDNFYSREAGSNAPKLALTVP